MTPNLIKSLQTLAWMHPDGKIATERSLLLRFVPECSHSAWISFEDQDQSARQSIRSVGMGDQFRQNQESGVTQRDLFRRASDAMIRTIRGRFHLILAIFLLSIVSMSGTFLWVKDRVSAETALNEEMSQARRHVTTHTGTLNDWLTELLNTDVSYDRSEIDAASGDQAAQAFVTSDGFKSVAHEWLTEEQHQAITNARDALPDAISAYLAAKSSDAESWALLDIATKALPVSNTRFAMMLETLDDPDANAAGSSSATALAKVQSQLSAFIRNPSAKSETALRGSLGTLGEALDVPREALKAAGATRNQRKLKKYAVRDRDLATQAVFQMIGASSTIAEAKTKLSTIVGQLTAVMQDVEAVMNGELDLLAGKIEEHSRVGAVVSIGAPIIAIVLLLGIGRWLTVSVIRPVNESAGML